MGKLTTQQADRLAKLCGMLGSDHDGERAASALMVSRYVKELGLTWFEILGIQTAVQQTARPNPYTYSTYEPPTPVYRMVNELANHLDDMTAKERDFVMKMGSWNGDPSTRQKSWLENLYAKYVTKAKV